MTKEEIIERIPLIIEVIFPYGEFTLEPIVPRTQVVNINIFGSDEEERGKVLTAIKEMDARIMHVNLANDEIEEILQYLIAEGFIINRHDIKQNGKIYRQLTDNGRKLKELGSINAYLTYQEDAKRKREQRDKMADQQHYFNKWITIGTIVTAVCAMLALILQLLM